MNLLAKIGLFGLVAGGMATALNAEPVGGWLSPNGQGAGGAGAGAAQSGAGVGSAGAGVAVTLSLLDMQNRVHLFHDQTRADARHIQHLQQVARKAKDVIKLNCVNDKLVQVKPQMNIADAAENELEGARDADRSMIFEQLSQAAENVRRLREEADQCIGEPTQAGGDSSNSFTGPTMPDDPTKGFDNAGIEPPGYASPFD
jgi:hypothetical protein